MSQVVTIPPADENSYEVVNGQRVENAPMGFFEIGLAGFLLEHLMPFVRAQQLGRARMETLFLLDPILGLERRPDVAFVSYERWAKKRKMPRGNAWAVVPNLAVEIISPTNLAEAIAVKIQEYFKAGVQLVWVINPIPGQVYAYESPTQVRILEKHHELVGDPVLPGFRLSVAALFEDELEGT
jgi:Uma2 family endonuclease